MLEGKCDGREPFDLQLAQGVAAAFVTRPDGIAKVARLLVHRDVSVRRRAAEAFSTLFERLGSGEHAQPAAAVDPALLPPARAALAPLVAFATTERDQQARCLGVRALMHAQQAVDDGAARRRRGGDRRPHAPLPGVAESLTGASRIYSPDEGPLAHGRRRHDGRAGGADGRRIGTSAGEPTADHGNRSHRLPRQRRRRGAPLLRRGARPVGEHRRHGGRLRRRRRVRRGTSRRGRRFPRGCCSTSVSARGSTSSPTCRPGKTNGCGCWPSPRRISKRCPRT